MDEDAPFNFDLERMIRAVDGPSYTVPDNLETLEQFDRWMANVVGGNIPPDEDLAPPGGHG